MDSHRYVKRYSKLLIVRKMHIKATMRHHLMAIRISKKGKKKKKCCRGCRHCRNKCPVLLVGKKVGTSTMKNIIDIFQIVKNRTTVWPRYFTSGCLSEYMKMLTWKDLCTSMFIAVLIHNKQDMEPT